MDAKHLFELGEELLAKKAPLNSLHQEICDNFYPERATFTTTRSWGDDFAAMLTTSFPALCRRELGNDLGTMLRPKGKAWFHPKRRWEAKEGSDVSGWLEYFEKVQRKAMFDRRAQFSRATKEGDHDYAALGQLVLSIELNRDANGLLYRCWHLRDMAWQEDEEGGLGFIVRRWKPTAYELVRIFGDKLDLKIKACAEKTPFEEIEVRHLVVSESLYDDNARGRPRWSIYWDARNQKIIEATPIWGRHYVIARWQTVSGSPYSYSPATVCALPDARLIQAMTYTLLEAAEKATSPPMIATKGVVRSDVAIYAGGITWVDQEYDERLGEALRPLTQDFRGFQFGAESQQNVQALLRRAFFLDQLQALPPPSADPMTAYEASQRVHEYIRNALPIFEPTEDEYNGAVCEETFSILWRNGAFGPIENWPKELRQPQGMRWAASDEVAFEFESPLHDLIEQQKGQVFIESGKLIATAVGLDPTAAYVPNTTVALRDALQAIGAPATWLHDQTAVDDAKRAAQAQAQQQATLANVEQASNAVKNFGQAGITSPAGAVA